MNNAPSFQINLHIDVWTKWSRFCRQHFADHYNDAIMSAMAYQITGVLIAYSTVWSGADQRKHESFASLAFVRGIQRWPVISPHNGPVSSNVSISLRHHTQSWYNDNTRCSVVFFQTLCEGRIRQWSSTQRGNNAYSTTLWFYQPCIANSVRTQLSHSNPIVCYDANFSSPWTLVASQFVITIIVMS